MNFWFKVIWIGLSIFIVVNMANSAFKGEYANIHNQNDKLVKENKKLKEQNKILSELVGLKKSSSKADINYVKVLSEPDVDTYVDVNNVILEDSNPRCLFGGEAYKFNVKQVFHENKIRAGYQYRYVLANFIGARCYRMGDSKNFGSLYNQRYYSQKNNLQYAEDTITVDTREEEEAITYVDLSNSLKKVVLKVLEIKGRKPS